MSNTYIKLKNKIRLNETTLIKVVYVDKKTKENGKLSLKLEKRYLLDDGRDN